MLPTISLREGDLVSLLGHLQVTRVKEDGGWVKRVQD